MNKIIITVDRECGTGGREIAHLLGEKRGFKVYDRGSLESIAKIVRHIRCAYGKSEIVEEQLVERFLPYLPAIRHHKSYRFDYSSDCAKSGE